MGKLIFLFQLLLIVLNLFLGNLEVLLSKPPILLIFIIGVLIGLAGLLSFERRYYSPFPQPKKNNQLITTGIYKYIRHPMYSGLMFIGLALMLSNINLLTAVIYILHVGLHNIKANYEEILLSKKHLNYKEYQKKTKKFIPLVY